VMIAKTAELVTSFEIVPSQVGGPVLTGVVRS
jgi:hypothetical protein